MSLVKLKIYYFVQRILLKVWLDVTKFENEDPNFNFSKCLQFLNLFFSSSNEDKEEGRRGGQSFDKERESLEYPVIKSSKNEKTD